MSSSPFFDPLLLLLDDPDLLDALLAGEDPELADAAPGAGAPPAAPVEPILDEAAIYAAIQADLAAAFGVDPTAFADADALIVALSDLEAPAEIVAPEAVSGEGSGEMSWTETVREDWALG